MKASDKKMTALNIFGGVTVGVVNGLIGGGGGMLAVPLLQKAGRSPQKAHATAIAVILPASVFSGAVYLLHGLAPLSLLVPVALGTTLGGFLGAKLLKALPSRWTELAFALLMLAAGLRCLF